MKVIETFREIEKYEESQLIQEEPSCFNGKVRVRKYRITIEEIEEPIEVIRGRIQALWDANENHHRVRPLRVVGKEYGMDLK